MKAFVGLPLSAVFFTTLLAARSLAAPIANPTEFCHAFIDALASQNGDKAADIVAGNFPHLDEQKFSSTRDGIRKVAASVAGASASGTVKFSELVLDQHIGNSIHIAYFYYLIGTVDAYFSCRVQDTGEGWQLRHYKFSTTIDNVIPGVLEK